VNVAVDLLANDVERLGLGQGSFDLVLLVHERSIHQIIRKVQLYFGVQGRASSLSDFGIVG